MSDAVQLSNITKSFGPVNVLSDVSISCRAGSVRALVGENGAGKSTLLKILTGSVAPDAGAVSVFGEAVDLEGWDPLESQRQGIAIVHQEFALLPNMTVSDNVFLGRERKKRGFVDRQAQEEETAALLSTVGCRVDPRARVEDLNIANAQLVEIAKALSQNAKVIALDEPSAVLSGRELETLFTVVEALRDKDVAVLYVSHRMDELFRLCDEFSVLKDGRVAGAGQIADTTNDEIIRMMVGRDVASAFPQANTPSDDVLLRLEDFHVDGLPAPISLTVRAGEVVGIAGLAGSGRSRLLKGIFGLIPSTGNLHLSGVSDKAPNGSGEAIDDGFAFIPEDRKQLGLALSQPVSSNLTLLDLPAIRRGGLLSKKKEIALATNLVSTYGIKSTKTGSEDVGQLSGGNQQKVVFAKWLQMSPKLVLLDEPTRGIDVAAKEEIYRVIRELSKQGVGFLMVSSELIEVLGLSHRVLVMVDGVIRGELPAGSTEEEVMTLVTETSHQPVGY